MGFVMNYVKAVMEKDPVCGRELMKLNSKHIAEELGIKLNPDGTIDRSDYNPKHPGKKKHSHGKETGSQESKK